jgi:hypothetical protein
LYRHDRHDVVSSPLAVRPWTDARIAERCQRADGAAAPFGLFWSDVPTGTETTCPAASSLLITPPGQTTALTLTGVAIAPCNSGTINVGPIRLPGSAIPS